MQYDAAIIGAGADGLAAAATLAKAGLKTIVIERAEQPGPRFAAREFHPGFRATPFCDEIAPVPPEIFWSLDLARRGAVFVPAAHSTALWADRAHILRRGHPLLERTARLAAAAFQRSCLDAETKRRRLPFISKPDAAHPWPGEDWSMFSLAEVLATQTGDTALAAHVMAQGLAGRAAHPALAGSALHLLAPGSGGSGPVAGGLNRLTDALTESAREAGAEIACGLEVTDVIRMFGRASGVRLADGTEMGARAVLSTLDLKRTFLSLFAWNDLPAEVARRVASFRMSGSTARLLFALDGLPDAPSTCDRTVFGGPIYLSPTPGGFSDAYTAWRAGTVPAKPSFMLRFSSIADPSSCPAGNAVMTATVGGVPVRLFDGAWTHDKRDTLRGQVLEAAEAVFPGLSSRVLGYELIVPPDIEEALGLTDGDFWGGEIASDQMFSMRSWQNHRGPRTPVEGVYLAGPSSAAGPFGTCAAGVVAAKAIIADLGRSK